MEAFPFGYQYHAYVSAYGDLLPCGTIDEDIHVNKALCAERVQMEISADSKAPKH